MRPLDVDVSSFPRLSYLAVSVRTSSQLEVLLASLDSPTLQKLVVLTNEVEMEHRGDGGVVIVPDMASDHKPAAWLREIGGTQPDVWGLADLFVSEIHSQDYSDGRY